MMKLNGTINCTIIGMVNPLYSGIMKGFTIELLDGMSSRVLERK